MGLDWETARRLRDCFRGQVCCQCGQQASQIFRTKFYCADHFPRGKSGEGSRGKVYRQPNFTPKRGS
jgi:hypothetical protein